MTLCLRAGKQKVLNLKKTIMKKSFLLSIFAIATLASCQKDAGIAVGGQTVEATFEATILTNATRTTAEVGDGVVSVLWAEDDAISMFAKGVSNSELTLEGEGGTTTGSFTGTITEGDSDSYIAYYPYAVTNALNGTTLNVTLPAKQTYVEGSLASAPMLAVSQTKSLAFKNLAALVRIVLKSEDNYEITSVALRGNAGEALAGAATVDVSAGTLALAQDAEATTLTLDCGNGIALSAEGTSFYFVVPAMTLANGFTIVATCADGDVMTKSTNNNVTLEAAKVYGYEAIEFEANTTIATSANFASVLATAEEGDIIMLSENVTMTEPLIINETQSIAIDLNGKELTTSTVSDNTNLPDDITVNGTLVVKNGVVNSANTAFYATGMLTLDNSTIISTGSKTVAVGVGGTNAELKATNCIVTANNAAFYALSGAKMTLTNCTASKIEETSNGLVVAKGLNTEMIINGGSYTGFPYELGYDLYVIGVTNSAKATINTTVTNGNGGVSVLGSTADFTGGSYSGGKACGLYVDGGSTVTYTTADNSETPCQFSGVEGAVVAGNENENSVDKVNGQEYSGYTTIVE